MKSAGWGAVLVLVAGITGCGTGSTSSGSGPLTVYLSVPLHGQRAAEGRRVVHGAQEALAQANGRAGNFEIGLHVLDDTGGGPRWSLVATGADARLASEDASTIAYVGELDPAATTTSAPITNLAEIPQVVPGEVPAGLNKSNVVGVTQTQNGQATNSNPGRAAIELVLAAIRSAGRDGGDRATVLDRLQKATGA